MWNSIIESLVVRFLPKIWETSFKEVEKKNLITKALAAAFKIKLIRVTWKSFCESVKSWLLDGISEVEQAEAWDKND